MKNVQLHIALIYAIERVKLQKIFQINFFVTSTKNLNTSVTVIRTGMVS